MYDKYLVISFDKLVFSSLKMEEICVWLERRPNLKFTIFTLVTLCR